jgi:mono/diheme cytochrome c family protein
LLIAAPQSTATASPAFATDDAGHRQTILPFLKAHCLKCHGPDRKEAGFRVDEHLPNELLTRSVAERWSEVLHKLNAGEMPPAKEIRPPAAEVAKVVDWIARERLRGEKARRGTEIVLRRLNRAEYSNTIRELTGVEMDAAADFPADPPAGGFDNNGGALTLSPLQLELYVRAARQVLDRAIVAEKERPASVRWHVEPEEGFKADKGPGGAFGPLYVTSAGQRISISQGCNQERNGMTVFRQPLWNTCGAIHVGGFKIPHQGMYIVRCRAAGVVPPNEDVVRVAMRRCEERQARDEVGMTPDGRRGHRKWWEESGRKSLQEHFSGRHYRYGPPRLKIASQEAGLSRVLGEFNVAAPESEPGLYEVRAWFEPGDDGASFALSNTYHIPRTHSNFWFQGSDDFPRPELLVDWIELEGPIYDAWPPSSHRRILPRLLRAGEDEEAYARDVLAAFMARAYRRPLREGEVEAKLELFQKARANHSSFEEAIKVPLIAVLSSPHFLFLSEASGEGDAKRALSGFELASRLSYFLWSSMPDDELLRRAAEEKLAEEQTLVAQTDRMLADPRSGELVKNFAGQWLKLRDVGTNPPTQSIYLEYDDHLEAAMRGESEAFFAHVLQNDLSVLSFLRSDFVTINERMARFYGIPGVKGDQFRVVPVPEGMQRGGVLTQAAVLAVTSNGTRTSPVWRGVWVLERLLGDPPAPPPPNAGQIPPKVPGIDKATVRERLRIHREQPQCAACHAKIDPLGFALENFDASGQWRERESQGNNSDAGPNDPPIDARAQLPGGMEFVGVAGLQDELLRREDQFLRCLAEKLTTYALGRELGYADEPTIATAVAHMKGNGKTLRSLIHHIVTSDTFRSK